MYKKRPTRDWLRRAAELEHPDEDDFAQLVAQADRQSLAREFEVAATTVDRWADGVSRPHPLVVDQVRRYIKGEGIS